MTLSLINISILYTEKSIKSKSPVNCYAPNKIKSKQLSILKKFSILAWRIPWTEEPGGLQSRGSQTV